MAREMTCKEAAKRWKISERRIAVLCKEGRIPGAHKSGKSWMIPSVTKKPADARHRGGSAVLPLPIGISDFKDAVSHYYYVDKTAMIRDFLDERPKVSLFTRPRRFGKTLTMDMLRVFFEKSEEDTSIYFQNLKIWDCGEHYRSFQGQYPVIFLTFKDVKFRTWTEAKDNIAHILAMEFGRHRELADSPMCLEYERAYYGRITSGTATDVEMTLALSVLSLMLHKHYGREPVIIIDEYDTPIQQGYMQGYYDDAILFMRNLFSGGFKDNPHLSFGFLTGILRVAKESIFSGLNNIKINSILDDRYSEYFGFTAEEVRQMAAYYQASEKYGELCEWYDGYHFGNTDIFNPWSVVSYFNNGCCPQAFWMSTGSNDIIGELLEDADADTLEQLHALMSGGQILTRVDTSVIYPQLHQNGASIYSFLLVAGYLKAEKTEQQFGGDYMCEVSLPNKEITFVYSKEILGHMQKIVPQSSASAIQAALYMNKTEALENALNKFLIQTISYNDASSESFYHGLILGICAMFDNRYLVSSNRESGEGRFDIQLMPKDKKMPGILMELKAGKELEEKQLGRLAEQALDQIEERVYETEMRRQGISEILKYGVAFSGKQVQIRRKADNHAG